MFQAVYTEAKEMVDNGTGEVVNEHEHEEGEDEETHEERTAYLYVWYDYVEDYYSYSKINSQSPDTYDPIIAGKILMTFDAANPFMDDEDRTALRAYVRSQEQAEATDITPEQIRTLMKMAATLLT